MRPRPVWVTVAFLVAGPAVAQPPAGIELTPDAQKRVATASARAMPSVVAVVVSHRQYPGDQSTDPLKLGRYKPGDTAKNTPAEAKLDLSDPQNAPDNLTGVGVVVDAAAGLVLVPYHLIEGATKVYARASSGGGSYADIHAADARSDLAVVRLLDRPDGLSGVRFAAVQVKARDEFTPRPADPMTPVVALTVSPNGLTVGSTWGAVSNAAVRLPGLLTAREEARSRPLSSYEMLIQATTLTRVGAGGCGLFNLDGELVGLSTPAAAAGAESAGVFVIPFDRTYRRIVDTLKAGREVEYGFLGVQLQGFGRFAIDRGGKDGVVITGVTPGGPADLAGLSPSDLITEIDGKPVTRQDDLFVHVAAALAGTRVAVRFKRYRTFGGAVEQTAYATLDKAPHSFPWLASDRPAPVFGLRVDYASVLQLEQGGALFAPTAGVSVRELAPDSPAAARFKTLGDSPTRWLVTAVDGRPVRNPGEFYAAARGKKSVTLSLADTVSGNPAQLTLPGS